jgi:hypothetical protein
LLQEAGSPPDEALFEQVGFDTMMAALLYYFIQANTRVFTRRGDDYVLYQGAYPGQIFKAAYYAWSVPICFQRVPFTDTFVSQHTK